MRVSLKEVLIVLFAITFLSTGCNKDYQNNTQGGSGLSILAPDAVLPLAPSVFSIVGGTIISATWKFTSENTGATLTPQCTAVEANYASISCIFQSPGPENSGKVAAHVSVTTALGTEELIAYFLLVLPSSANDQDLLTAVISQSGATIGEISNKGGTPGTPMSVVQNSPVSFDMEKSKTKGPVTFQVSFGTGEGSAILNPGSFLASHTFARPGLYNIVVVASGDGVVSTLSFLLQVTCDASVPAVQVTSITVTKKTKNRYQYVATVTGGSGTFRSIWVPDGSGVYRMPAVSGLSIIYYEDYVGERNVSVNVIDLACGTNYLFDKKVTFDIPTSDGVPGTLQGPQVDNLPFLQGHFSSTTDPMDPRVNGMMSILQDELDPQPRRVTGQYVLNKDGTASFKESALTPINDNKDGIAIEASFDQQGVMTMKRVTVYIAGNTDLGSALKNSFTTTSCAAQGTVTTLMGPNPCKTESSPPETPDQIIKGYEIDYTYSCPVLSDGMGHTMAIDNGAGHYIYNISADNCGGGGGDGGSPPTPF